MAAAGVGASILEAVMMLRGVEDTIGGLRQAGGGFDELRQQAERANDAIGQIRSATLSLGASSGQVGAVGAAFQSIGLSMDHLRSEAEAFRERLFTDPFAQRAFGGTVLPARLGGPSDSLQFLDQAVGMLREATAGEERLAMARAFQLQSLLPLADAETRFYEAMRKEGERTGAQVDPDLRRLRGNSEALDQRLKSIGESNDIALERSRLGVVNWWKEHVQIPFENLTRARDTHATGSPETSQEANTRAMQENTAAVLAMRKDFANVSQRANQAIPRGLSGHQFASEARALGAFEA